jgi:hypothetical protein
MSYFANIAAYAPCLKYLKGPVTKKITYRLTETNKTTDTPAKKKNNSTSSISLK